jgi:periplasmic mercuric ion binding protein
MKKQNLISTIAFFAIIIMAITVNLIAQDKAQTSQEIKIKTSAQCEMCKARIEKALKKVDGIESAVLNLKTKEAEIKYNPAKTNPDEIRKAIAKIGYDADEEKADMRAYNKLPKCCKKDGGHSK